MTHHSSSYRIRNWAEQFETRGTARQTRPRTRIAIPTSLDGLRLRRLLADPQGATAYGVWVLLLQIAAKTPVRGTLADDSGPYSTADIVLLTGIPEPQIITALDILSSQHIGLLELVTTETALPASIETETPTGATGQTPDLPQVTPPTSASNQAQAMPTEIPPPEAPASTAPATLNSAFTNPRPSEVQPFSEGIQGRNPNQLPSEVLDLSNLHKFRKPPHRPRNKQRHRQLV